MRFTGWICSAVLCLSAASAQAKDCVPAAEMQEIAQHFTQFKTLADKGEYCFDDSQTSHLIAGIMFMRKTQFASDMPASADELFSGSFKNDWYGYFIGRITDFDVVPNCPTGVIAYVYMFGTTMYVCPLALTANFTALDRASVFMHEARHIDGFPHVTCSHGPRTGIRGACDSRISNGGSYAVTVETYAQIAKYAGDLHPAMRAYSRSSALIYADEAFETPVRINRTQQFLVLTNDRKFHTMNLQTSTFTDLGDAPSLGTIVMRAQHMILFPDDKNEKARYVFARGEGETDQQAGAVAAEYNSGTPADRANFVSMHSSGQWNARLYKNKAAFSCDPTSDAVRELTLTDTPAGLLYPNGYDRSQALAHFISVTGRVYEIGCANGSPFVRPSALTLDQPYKRVQKVGQDVIGLSQDGRLFRIQGATSTRLQTPYDGRVYELVPNQFLEFLDKN